MLENIIEQTDLITPADALELSINDLEEVNGAGGFGGFGGPGGFGSCGFGSCFTAIKFNVAFNECFEFFTFGSCGFGSCGSCGFN